MSGTKAQVPVAAQSTFARELTPEVEKFDQKLQSKRGPLKTLNLGPWSRKNTAGLDSRIAGVRRY